MNALLNRLIDHIADRAIDRVIARYDEFPPPMHVVNNNSSTWASRIANGIVPRL